MKLIVLELNEVPFRVIDWFASINSEFSGLLSHSLRFTTLVRSDHILSPWTTWPTLHTGQTQTQHRIQDLGQELIDYYPLWQQISDHGYSSSVYGSLHSSSTTNTQDLSFFVPDYFTSRPITKPLSLQPFALFQHQLTAASSRNVSRSLKLGDLTTLRSLFHHVPPFSILPDIAYQILHESLRRERSSRRRDIQTLINFQVYLQLLLKYQPHFSTFFVNSVAASMHRFWAATFPEDFPLNQYPLTWQKTYRKEIYFSMTIVQRIITSLHHYCTRNNANLLVLSSMGQSSYQSVPSTNTWACSDIVSFVTHLFPQYVNRLKSEQSMFPIYTIKSDASTIKDLYICLKRLSPSPSTKFRVRMHSSHMSLSIEISSLDQEAYLELDDHKLPLSQLPFSFLPVSDSSSTTAYHIPEGSALVFGQEAAAIHKTLTQGSHRPVFLDKLHSSILQLYPRRD